MKKSLLLSLSVIAAAIPAVASAQNLPASVIAVIDTDRIRTSCTACGVAIAQLNAEGQRIQQRAQQLGQPLETEAAALRTAVQALPANTQPDAALRARIGAFEQRQQAAQQEIGTQQQTLQRNVNFVRTQIDAAINAAAPDVMRARGANVAIDRGVTIAIAPTIEVTDALLALVNQRLTTINVTAPPPAGAPAAPGATPAPPPATPRPTTPRPTGR